ncbi:MAG: hypothetical protein ACK41D_04475 [Rubricoccaceae bacterium]
MPGTPPPPRATEGAAAPLPLARPPFARPEPLSLSFEGFPDEGFEALARLRSEPHIGRYQAEKPVLDRAVTAPFKRYRDDLAVNWVLPNGLPFETERGVFSRILKNDFGAGGSHHHLWMAFYRPPLKRLTDAQLSHGVYPDGFAFSLYVGAYAGALFRAARQRMLDEAPRALALLNPLLSEGFHFAFAPHVTKPEGRPTFSAPLARLPAGVARAGGLWVRHKLPRETVQRLGPGLVGYALGVQEALWPLYRFWLGLDDED